MSRLFAQAALVFGRPLHKPARDRLREQFDAGAAVDLLQADRHGFANAAAVALRVRDPSPDPFVDAGDEGRDPVRVDSRALRFHRVGNGPAPRLGYAEHVHLARPHLKRLRVDLADLLD